MVPTFVRSSSLPAFKPFSPDVVTPDVPGSITRMNKPKTVSVIRIPKTTNLHLLTENRGAVSVEFSSGELQEINMASSELKVHGERYSGCSALMINR